MTSLVLDMRTDTLVKRLWPEADAPRALRGAVLVTIGSVLLALASQLSIPWWPVPLTGQTFAVLVIGMAFGARLGMLTLLAYLIEGAIGLPFFAGGAAGLAPLAGPSGGYLIGFVLASGVTGWLAQRGWGRNAISTAGAMLIGNIVLYVPGLLWLFSFLHLGVHGTLAVGLIPFLLGDLTKLLLATAAMPLAWRLLGNRRR